MYKRFFRVIMIMMLALGMLGGSFVTSMAMAVSDDIQAVNFDAATSAELEEGAAPTSVEESVAPSEENATPVPTVKDVSTNEEGTKDVDNSQDDNTNDIPQDVEVVDNQKIDNQKTNDSVNKSQENNEVVSDKKPVVEVSSEPVKNDVLAEDSDQQISEGTTVNTDNNSNIQGNIETPPTPQGEVEDNEVSEEEARIAALIANAVGTVVKDTPHWEGHTQSRLVYISEIDIPATCTEDGLFEKTVYCGACNKLLVQRIIRPSGHDPSEPFEDSVDPTCAEDGHVHSVITCKVCHEELDRTELKVLPAIGHHTPGEAVEENRVDPTATEDGSYETVVRCSVCGEELSREPHVLPATGKTDDKKDEQKDDKEDDSKTDTIPEVIEEVIEEIGVDDPSFLVIRDGANILMAEVDENGYASFDDVLTILEEGSNASEVITLKVNGISYTFTRYADGRVVGMLPPGFSIEGNVLKVKVPSGKFSISVTNRSATSSTAHEAVEAPVEAPESPGKIAGVFSEPGTEDPSSAVTVLPEPAATEEFASPSRRTNTSRTDYAEEETYTTLEEAALSVIEPETKASDTDDKDAASNPILRSAPRYGSELQSEGLLDGSAASKFLIAADIVLTLGLLVGLGILWKLGLFKF